MLLPDVKADYVHQDESHDEVNNLGDYFDENLWLLDGFEDDFAFLLQQFKVLQDMKYNDKRLANKEDDQNWVVEHHLTSNFWPKLLGVLNGKSEFYVSHDYYEVVHEKPLEPSCKGIQNFKPIGHWLWEISIFCEYSSRVQEEATNLAY